MSDDFIPLNQSTPVQNKWQNRANGNQHDSYQNSWPKKKQHRRGHHLNNWHNNSQHSNSFGSDYNSSDGRENTNIGAYLHPSMFRDPWAHLTKDKK